LTGDPEPGIVHLFLRNPMTQREINDAIALAFGNLAETNQMIYDYWISELYDEDGDLVCDAWNAENLKLMEDDVMEQVLAADNL
jgi:hypothetical protein